MNLASGLNFDWKPHLKHNTTPPILLVNPQDLHIFLDLDLFWVETVSEIKLWENVKKIALARLVKTDPRAVKALGLESALLQGWAGMTFGHLGTGMGMAQPIPKLWEREREW